MLFFCSSDKPNQQVKGDPERTVFVARLSDTTREGKHRRQNLADVVGTLAG